jgi:AraC-like DNA-binding protein
MSAAAPIDPLCRILTVQRAVLGPWWSLRLCDPFWRLYLNGQSGAEIAHPGGVHRLAPGRIHLLPAWGEFTGRCREPVEQWYVHADLADWGRAAFAAPIALAPDAAMCASLRELSGPSAWSAGGRLRMRAFVLAALAQAVDQLPAEAQDGLLSGLAGDDPVAVARRFVEQHLAEDLDLQRLSSACGLSPRHLGEVFRARTGRTPMAYLRERRVAHAAELLLSDRLPIEQVAERCGFVNRHHFSRIFAGMVGCGPAAYRRTRQPGEEAIAAWPPIRGAPGTPR